MLFKAEPAELNKLESMTKEELIREVMRARIREARLKRIRGEGRWYGNPVRHREYQVIMELSGEFPVKALCEEMGIVRSSFYGWKKRLSQYMDLWNNETSATLFRQNAATA